MTKDKKENYVCPKCGTDEANVFRWGPTSYDGICSNPKCSCRLSLDKFTIKQKIVILTGAGISKPSDIPTFRDTDGIWAKYDPAEYCTREAQNKNPDKVKSFLRLLTEELKDKEPNLAHKTLASFEQFYPDTHIVTQNIDDLHEKAGSKNVYHIHGDYREFDKEEGIVLFGDQLKYMDEVEKLLSEAKIFISIGTSDNVSPACDFYKLTGPFCHRIQVNLEETEESKGYHKIFLGCVTKTMPEVLSYLHTYLTL